MRKKIYHTEVKIYSYDVDSNNLKLNNTENLENIDEWDELHIFADENKVFRRISTQEILTSHIGIGSEDNVNDFEEIDKEY